MGRMRSEGDEAKRLAMKKELEKRGLAERDASIEKQKQDSESIRKEHTLKAELNKQRRLAENTEKSKKEFEHLANQGIKGYDSITSAMTEVFRLVILLARIYSDSMPNLGQKGLTMVREKIQTALADRKAEQTPHEPLPMLNGFIDFSGDKLNHAPFKKHYGFSKAQLFDEATEKVFEESLNMGVTLWLEEQGYKPIEGQAGTFEKEGAQLNQETFNTLARDPDNGLESFLSRYTELQTNLSFGATPTLRR